MSNSSDPKPSEPKSSESTHEKRSTGRVLAPLLKIAAGLGVIVAAGGLVAVVWGDRLIESQIIPIVEEEVETTIGRPVEIGEVRGLSFWGIRLGPSSLPPTATDATSATVEEVQVRINLRALLLHREIQPDIVLISPEVNLVQAVDGQWIELDLPEAVEDPPFELELQNVEVRDARITVATQIQDPDALVTRTPVVVDNVNVNAIFTGETSKQVAFELAGDVDTGRFDIQGEGDLEQLAVQANVRLQDLPTTGANLVLPSLLGLSGGVLNTNLTAAAALTEAYQLDLASVDVQGTARFRDGEVQVQGLPTAIRNINSRLRFQGQQVTLEETGLQVDDITLMATGEVHLQSGHDLRAQIPEVAIADLQSLAELDLPIAANGVFQLDAQVTGDLLDPQVRGRLTNRETVQVDQVAISTLATNFALDQAQFDLTELRIVPEAGGVVLAQGKADITDLTQPEFQLTAQADIPVDAYTGLYGVSLPENIVIGDLTADVAAEGTLESQTAVVQWQLSESSFPGAGELTLADNQLVLDPARLQVADGTIMATAIADLTTGNWQATATTDQVPVEEFTPQAQGLLTANLNASGNLYDFDLATIQAGGDATIANALVQPIPTAEPLLPQGDWTTEFTWQGDRLTVNRFTAPNIQADGTIGVDFTQAIPIGALALNVVLRDYDLQPLNSFAPDAVRAYGQLAGLTSFEGQITGTLDNPQLTGDARLVALALNEFAFEPLAGPVNLSLAQGGELDLRSRGGDRVALTVNADPWPTAFEVRNQDFVASGTGEGRRIDVDIQQFPLDQLAVQPATDYGFGVVSGWVDMSVTADLADFQNPIASGTLTVREPGLDPVAAERLTTAFRYADGTATLDQGELLFDDSRILLAGSASLQPELEYTGQLTVAEGHVEDLVAIAETLDLKALRLGLERPSPTGNAADLKVQSIRLPQASFLEQLEAFIAFEAAQPEATPTQRGQWALPPMDTLTGEFSGGLTVAGRSLDLNALTADFNFRGQSWTWGSYDPSNQFIISGNVQQGTVVLDPVSVIVADTVVNLSGRGSLERLEGDLLVDNLPVELASVFYPLPVAVTGDIDITTQLTGSLANPRIEGELLVVEPAINEQPLERVAATFGYRNAVLEVDGGAALAPNDAPMTLRGTVPYALPFMTVRPATDQIALTAVVPDDTFDFVNVFTDEQLRWEGGDGEVVVRVRGSVFNPEIAGTATFRDGIVGSSELGNPLTNINGQVQFDLAQVRIPRLQAQMGDGTVAVVGQLPLQLSGQSLLAQVQTKQQTEPDAAVANGMLISLGELPIDYRGIVDLQLDGQVAITGAVLAPTISGGVELDEGYVRANQLLQQLGALNLPTPEEVEQINPYRAAYLGIDPFAPSAIGPPSGFLDKVVLDDFMVAFSDRLVVDGQPFYNLTADGGLTVNGTFSDLKPDGEIDLRTGWINLFSAQFRLDSSAPNAAVFTPEDGLDPYVNVVLTARVQENDISRVPPTRNGFASSEISDNDIQSVGNVEFIRVRAVAVGYASELNDSLALTSNPARSQQELVALLGSNVAGGLASASLTQVAGFFGAGGLAGFGNNLADTLGLQSFSVFPTTDTSAESTAGVGIGVEASFAIGDSIGINVLEILNSGNPPQFGLQYRFTDELQLRGASNLNDTDVRLEYRTSF
ncbi:MAG: translocation/assembly module TamB domain-containing protein [Cyanobacteria bacterium P01_D01_bin.6]